MTAVSIAASDIAPSQSSATERRPRRAPQAAVQASSANLETRLASLAGMLAHELKNPLASAITNLAVAVELSDESDPRRPFLNRANQELERIDALLVACLGLACSAKIRRREIDVAQELKRLGATDFVLDVEQGLRAFVDPSLFSRCIENVLENARRELGRQAQGQRAATQEETASASAASIRIEAKQVGDALVVRIHDAGPGIQPALRERLFEPFVSASGGSGLGLAFVKRVCTAHDGDVTVRQSSLGGALFELRFGAGA